MVELEFDKDNCGWKMRYEKVNTVYTNCDNCGCHLFVPFYVDTVNKKSYCERCALHYIKGNSLFPEVQLDKIIEVIDKLEEE